MTDISMSVKYMYGIPVDTSGEVPSLISQGFVKGYPAIGSLADMVPIDAQSKEEREKKS